MTVSTGDHPGGAPTTAATTHPGASGEATAVGTVEATAGDIELLKRVAQ